MARSEASRCRARTTRIFERRIVIQMVALSGAMREVVGLAERVATTDANVLVTGEELARNQGGSPIQGGPGGARFGGPRR